MAPTTETTNRVYCVLLKDRSEVIRVKADILSKPTGTRNTYSLKSGEDVVAEFHQNIFEGWWLDEADSSHR